MKAFVAAKVGTAEHLGLIKTVREEIAKIPGMVNVFTVFGRYDLIVEVEVKSLSELARLIDDKIRAITGVVATETFISYEIE